jgi:hypothetical protein
MRMEEKIQGQGEVRKQLMESKRMEKIRGTYVRKLDEIRRNEFMEVESEGNLTLKQ